MADDVGVKLQKAIEHLAEAVVLLRDVQAQVGPGQVPAPSHQQLLVLERVARAKEKGVSRDEFLDILRVAGYDGRAMGSFLRGGSRKILKVDDRYYITETGKLAAAVGRLRWRSVT